MKIMLMAPAYPSEKNKHFYAFVHARAKIYKKNNNIVVVFVPNHRLSRYVYEHVPVLEGPLNSISAVVDEYDPDVIGIDAPSPYLLRILGKTRRPIVTWFHGVEVLMQAFHHYIPPYGVKNNIERMQTILSDVQRNLKLRRLLKFSVAVVYVSQWMRKMTERYLMLHHPNSFVISNPVDTELFKPSNIRNTKVKLNAISVRGLDWKYGLDIAIRAFSKSEVKLTILGKGPLEKYLKALAKSYNSNVRFITEGIEHEKLPMIYNKYAFFVAPSRTEAQGVAMCEAMACGLPVVATRVGGIPEFVKDNYTGLLVPPGNYLKLKEAVKLLISNNDLYSLLSKNARQYVVDNLSEKVIYEKEFIVLKLAQKFSFPQETL